MSQQITSLIERLASIWKLSYQSASTGQKSGWAGSGTGLVRAENACSGVLMFHEEGTWKSVDGREFHFTNVYRWTAVLDDNRIRLEHLRFGPENPVYLFDMKPIGRAQWTSVQPHMCREDCYEAEMKIGTESVELCWRIRGPEKQETIRYTYW